MCLHIHNILYVILLHPRAPEVSALQKRIKVWRMEMTDNAEQELERGEAHYQANNFHERTQNNDDTAATTITTTTTATNSNLIIHDTSNKTNRPTRRGRRSTASGRRTTPRRTGYYY